MNDMSDAGVITSQPQYALVAQTLFADIRRGHYPVGSLLPPEHDLCKLFGVSRHTVREAIRRLQERGLVTRQRGIGTSVRANQIAPHYVQSATSIADLPRYVEDTRLVVTNTANVIADESLAGVLKCSAGQRWVKVSAFRYAGKEQLPMALTHIYVNAAYGGVQTLIGAMKVPVYKLIEQQYGETVVEIKQDICATTLSAIEAGALKAKPGSAGLLISRQYIGANDRIIEVAVNLHPADRFSYAMSLRLSSKVAA